MKRDLKALIGQMTLEEKASLCSGSDFWHTQGIERLGIPAVMVTDGPHGLRKQAGEADHLGLNDSVEAVCFPAGCATGSSFDPDLLEHMGQVLGDECQAEDVSILLGPAVNIKRSPLCGRDFEYFSEDPYLSGKLAAGYVRGIQSVGVSACPKHFAANNQELRRMASNSVLDERTLRELYLTGFEIAVKEGRPKCIMTSYNRVNGTYANENHHLLQDILHGEWGYDGAVVTDWGGSNDHVEGVREGSTLEMPCPGFGSAKRLMQAVEEGRLPESAVDARVDELLELVFTTDAAVKAAPKRFDRDAHHALARRAAAESVVLLKNEDDLLPLKPGQSVALIGDFAQTPRYQGAGSSSVNATRVDNLKDAAEADDITLAGFCAGYERSGTPNPAFVEEAAALARKADVAVLCMGLDESSESEGLDRSHICIPENQKQLLEAVAQANENLVVVLSAGSVVETGWVSRCKAVLHAYLGGQAGAGAIMDVLTGRVNPSGKLAETLPLTYEDTPAARYFPGKQQNVEYREGLYIGYRYYETAHVPVRYPFGYGLSYTTFAYSDLKADADKVTFTITNTGSRAGAEIAQLYVAKADAAVFRPEKELKGFAKVFLQAGECKTVTIPLDDKAFRYWNVKTDRWETEGGSYQLLVGASVQDIRLRAEVSVQGTGAPDPYAGKAVQCYRTADIKNVPDAAFEALLGHAIPEDKPHIDQTMTLGELNHSRSPLCWLAWAVLHTLLKRSSREGTPDLNLLFQYNMPVRALAQMTGGMVGQETVDGIVMEAKGFWIIGLLRALIGFGQNAVSNRKFRAALDAERGGPAV